MNLLLELFRPNLLGIWVEFEDQTRFYEFYSLRSNAHKL